MTYKRMQFTLNTFLVKCQYSKSNVFVTYIIRFFLIKVDDTFKHWLLLSLKFSKTINFKTNFFFDQTTVTKYAI